MIMILSVLLGLVLLVPACSKSPDPASHSENGPLSSQAQTTKASYVQKTNQELQEWSFKVKSLEERSRSGGAKTRNELDHYVRKAKENLADLKKSLQALAESTEGAWEPLQRGLEETLEKLKRNYEKAISYFDKSDPAKPGL